MTDESRPVPRPLWMTVLTQILLVVFSAIFILPFVWLVSSSLKPDEQIFRVPPEWIPRVRKTIMFEGQERDIYGVTDQGRTFQAILEEADGKAFLRPLGSPEKRIPKAQVSAAEPVRHFGLFWPNYPKGLAFIHFGRQLLNTLIICGCNVIGSLISCSLVAYGLSRVQWKGRDWLFYIILGTMMIPAHVTMVPMFVVFAKMRWVNTFLPLTVPAFLANGFFVFLLRQFFLGIPNDLTDAARLDGCSELGIWARIVMPLSKPALATIGLFAFLGSWNDYLGPLIYLSEESKYTLSLGIASFSSQYGSFPGMLMAVSTVMTVPIIVLFFFTQRTFIQGITLTGLKG